MSPFDIIARLERSPAAWVCIRREAADEIKKLREDVARLNSRLSVYVDKASLHDQARESETFWFRRARELEDKLDAAVEALHHVAASDGLIAPLAAAVLREIEETK